MNEMEKLLEKIAADLVMVNLDDLPALAGLHEEMLKLSAAVNDTGSIVYQVSRQASDLIEKIILNEVPDKNHSLNVLNEAIVGLQGLIRDKRQPSEVSFPSEFNLPEMTAGKKRPAGIEPESRAKAISDETASAPANEKAVPKPVTNNKEVEPLIIDLSSGDSSLVGDFITEAREHCTTAEQMLMDLETNPENQAAINAIFRSFHTIKGAAGFLDLKPIMVLAHESETLLDLGRKGTIAIVGKVADAVFDSIDIMQKLLTST